ncbi:MAG: transposase [Syntrophotaleaceae bacterium]
MPRQPRLDIPGLLQHVIVRGIERTAIFLDDNDRLRFVERLDQLLVKTETDCFAWALIPNHFHLLLRCNRVELSRFMRRLLTGHAVYFNLRHNRSGHLFQNRYKSMICEEDSYFLELIRYIHLNPLRAGLVSTLEELSRYPWCGHSVILGHQILSGQSVDAVLASFGRRKARQRYQQFIADGLAMGEPPHLVGKSQKPSGIRSKLERDSIRPDKRILGSGELVQSLREHEIFRESPQDRKSLPELQKDIADYFDLEPVSLIQRGRQSDQSSARALFCFLSVVKLRYPGVKAGEVLGIGASSVSRAIQRGEELFRSREDLQVWWDGLMH